MRNFGGIRLEKLKRRISLIRRQRPTMASSLPMAREFSGLLDVPCRASCAALISCEPILARFALDDSPTLYGIPDEAILSSLLSAIPASLATCSADARSWLI